jgi:hypothetical protein
MTLPRSDGAAIQSSESDPARLITNRARLRISPPADHCRAKRGQVHVVLGNGMVIVSGAQENIGVRKTRPQTRKWRERNIGLITWPVGKQYR